MPSAYRSKTQEETEQMSMPHAAPFALPSDLSSRVRFNPLAVHPQCDAFTSKQFW